MEQLSTDKPAIDKPAIDQLIPFYTVPDAEKVMDLYEFGDSGYNESCKVLGYNPNGIWKVLMRQPVKRDSPQSLYGRYLRVQKDKAHREAEALKDAAYNLENDPRHNANRMKSCQYLASHWNKEHYGERIELDHKGSVVQVYKPDFTKPCGDNANVAYVNTPQTQGVD